MGLFESIFLGKWSGMNKDILKNVEEEMSVFRNTRLCVNMALKRLGRAG